MSERREYELTMAQFNAILEASKPTQENANRVWAEIGREMGFKWMTVRPQLEKGVRRFTAEPATPAEAALITPCPVCQSIEACPHTPVRCQHRWWYGKNPSSLLESAPDDQKIGGTRECEHCRRVERAVLTWETVTP